MHSAETQGGGARRQLLTIERRGAVGPGAGILDHPLRLPLSLRRWQLPLPPLRPPAPTLLQFSTAKTGRVDHVIVHPGWRTHPGIGDVPSH